MIMVSKKQLAELLATAYTDGAVDGVVHGENWVGTEAFHDARERAIQPLVHRSSGGHDDHGREVK